MWEYKIVYVNARKQTETGLPEEINEVFNTYGREGWELTKVQPKLDGGVYCVWDRMVDSNRWLSGIL